jgi:predicted phosphodiesterase
MTERGEHTAAGWRPLSGPRIAVISDVHGNPCAYRAALDLACQRGFDELIVLGDLLTYGCEPIAVLDLTQEAVERHGALLIKGNHDQLYFDLRRDDFSYYGKLPEWTREVVDWTRRRIDGFDLEGAFRWHESLSVQGIVFAHANPFRYGDWRYLSSPNELRAAALALSERSACLGVFGHTHRYQAVEVDLEHDQIAIRVASDENPSTRLQVMPYDRRVALVDAGSVGQPRGLRRVSTMAFVFLGRDPALEVELEEVRYDDGRRRRTLAEAALSETTKTKLLSYFPS